MTLKRKEASDAVTDLGWRLVLGAFRAYVPASSIADAARIALSAAEIGDERLRIDVRADGVHLTIEVHASRVGAAEVELAKALSAALPTTPDGVQAIELGIDAMDIPAVLPFWEAVLAYERVGDALVDPAGLGPAVWFQQMDEPRRQRNRIHFDVSVPHDQTEARIAAALAAGGTLVYDKEAPAFWVLADPEGNEACVTCWQGRD
ncbi:VOC family protein [Fodinicola acaciae]|uniref:VOC family protein n=1 Tax=Fodinicola acaciae TaxID=2681555 RepID=UPI0013D21388|nr:VOC family protein [Fodinicola acaciae]